MLNALEPDEALQAQERIFQTSSSWAKMFGKRSSASNVATRAIGLGGSEAKRNRGQHTSDLGGSRAFLSAFEVLQAPLGLACGFVSGILSPGLSAGTLTIPCTESPRCVNLMPQDIRQHEGKVA